MTPWYQTQEWSEKDADSISRRRKRYNGFSEWAQVVRIKCKHLIDSRDPHKISVARELLLALVREPEAQPPIGSVALSSEIATAWLYLAGIAEREQDWRTAEAAYRRDYLISSTTTEGTGLSLACFLSRFNDPEKLEEAARLLDQVESTKEPPQLLFRMARLKYCVARARISAKQGDHGAARAFASQALELDKASPVDSFKQTPMDKPLLDEIEAAEMKQILLSVK